jgi:hypothetical protein
MRGGNFASGSGKKILLGNGIAESHPAGRWPANLVLSHTPECERVGERRVQGETMHNRGQGMGYHGDDKPRGQQGYADADGTETVAAWRCAPGCAVAMLDAQSGDLPGRGNISRGELRRKGGITFCADMLRDNAPHLTRGDAGGASRFFYTAKASRSDREEGLRGHLPCLKCGELDSEHHMNDRGQRVRCRRNPHPTVKSTPLMQWLCRLITPPGGIILDPFCGSGSTGKAALLEGFGFVGIEYGEANYAIAERRIAHARQQIPMPLEVAT